MTVDNRPQWTTDPKTGEWVLHIYTDEKLSDESKKKSSDTFYLWLGLGFLLIAVLALKK
jgi:hypothetical protein